MSTVKTRVAAAGGRFLIKRPRSRLTRFVVRLVLRRVSGKLAAVAHVDAIPAPRGSRLTTAAGVAAVAGGVTFLARRHTSAAKQEPAYVPPVAPVPAAAQAPPTTPAMSPAAEVPPTSPAAEVPPAEEPPAVEAAAAAPVAEAPAADSSAAERIAAARSAAGDAKPAADPPAEPPAELSDAAKRIAAARGATSQ